MVTSFIFDSPFLENMVITTIYNNYVEEAHFLSKNHEEL
jgi:hypothetical protein